MKKSTSRVTQLVFLFTLLGLLYISSFLKHIFVPPQSQALQADYASGSALLGTDHLSIVPTHPVAETLFSSLEYLGAHLPSEESAATSPAALVASTTDQEYCLDVPILLYHHTQPLLMAKLLGHEKLTIDSEIFDEQMQYLVTHGYTTISAEHLVEALLTYQPLPPKSVMVTIDDGYDDNYTYAFMTAKKYQMIINFMIPTALIGKPGYMTWDHVQEMNASPYARLYNHTATHAPVGLLTEPQIEAELASSSATFKEKLGLENTVFTYPYGSVSPLAIEMLKKHGFTAGLTTVAGRKQCRSEIMTLHRDHIGNAPLTLYGL